MKPFRGNHEVCTFHFLSLILHQWCQRYKFCVIHSRDVYICVFFTYFYIHFSIGDSRLVFVVSVILFEC